MEQRFEMHNTCHSQLVIPTLVVFRLCCTNHISPQQNYESKHHAESSSSFAGTDQRYCRGGCRRHHKSFHCSFLLETRYHCTLSSCLSTAFNFLSNCRLKGRAERLHQSENPKQPFNICYAKTNLRVLRLYSMEFIDHTSNAEI